MQPSPHRKRVRHIHDAGHCRELTFSCYRRMPLLTNDVWRAMLSESIRRACLNHGYSLVAFVYMPEHVHLIAFPGTNSPGVDGLLRAIKRPYSYRIKQLLVAANSPLLDRLTIRQRPGVTTFRFWQEGPGYDRNLTTPRTIQAAIDYVHENPVRRSLCQRATDWRWSSARLFLEPTPEVDDALPPIHKLPVHFLEG
ncbi:MAG: transposase [Pirellulales bacterium]